MTSGNVRWWALAVLASAGAVALAAPLTSDRAASRPAPVLTHSEPQAAATETPSAPVAVAPAAVALAASVPAPPAAPSIASAGMRVAIDPETGAIVPDLSTPLGTSAFTDNWSTDGLTIERLPDGTEIMHLQGRSQEYSVASIGPDGRLKQDCVDGPQVEAWLDAEHARAATATRPSVDR